MATTQTVQPLITITPWSLESIGDCITSAGGTGLRSISSTVYPAANLALYVPFSILTPVTVVQMFCYNGAAVAGNVDIGIYNEYGTGIVSMGSTAQAGVNSLQSFNIVDTILGAGIFYMSITLDDAAATLFSGSMAVAGFPAITGMAQEAAAFPLPATATFARITGNYIPLFGLSIRTLL